LDLGEVLRVGGRRDEAVSVLEEALSLYERKGNIAAAAKTRALLDAALLTPPLKVQH
jgi:hypothetical protein